MAGIVFSKLSGRNDSVYKAVEGYITEILQDAMTGVAKNDFETVLKSIFLVKSSKKSGERMGGLTEFSDFEIVPEGGAAVSDEVEEGFGKLIEHVAFMKDFKVTREMIKDGRIDEARMAATNFANAYHRSRLEFATRALVTEGSTFMYGGKKLDKTTGDGKALFATDHPGKRPGVKAQSNVFTNPIGTDTSMINRLAIWGRGFKNDSGHVQGYTFDTVVIPGNTPRLENQVKVIIGSLGEIGNNWNDINTQRGKWKLVVNQLWEAADGTEPYILMSSDAKNALMGSTFWERENLDITNEIDQKTRNFVWNGYTRYSAGFYNWRHVIMGGAQVGTPLPPLTA